MVDNDKSVRHAEWIDDCDLQRSERNRYFHGKLMSARDMQAEQRYYRGLHTRHSRYVAGQGVVSGLEITDIEDVADEVDVDGDFRVTIDAGYAIDCCGRPVVVPEDGHQILVDGDDGIGDTMWVFLVYDECVLETVPVAGSEDACENECEYNRVLEVFDITVSEPNDDSSPSKPLQSVTFPTLADKEEDEDVAYDTIAREYESDPDELPLGVGKTDEHAVFLGQYSRGEGGWEKDESGPLRSRLYTNDMLYSAVATHTADFENPHQVTLETAADDDGAILRNDHDHREDADVTVQSPDDTLAIDVTDQTITLNEGTGLTGQLSELEEREFSRVLRYTHQAFTRGIYRDSRGGDRLFTYGNGLGRGTLQEWGAEEHADAIRTKTKEMIVAALDEPDADPLDEFGQVVERQRDFSDVIHGMLDAGIVTPESEGRLMDAISDVESVVAEDGAQIIDIATAQDEFCQAAVLLEAELQPAEFVVTDLNPDDIQISHGESFGVTSEIRNVGDESATQAIELAIDEEIVDDSELSLEGGDSGEVTFEQISTEAFAPGTLEFTVSSDQDSESGTLELIPESKPTIQWHYETEREVTEGSFYREPTTEAVLTGDSNLHPDQDVVLELLTEQQGTKLDEETVSVDEDGSLSVTFDLSDREAGEYFLQGNVSDIHTRLVVTPTAELDYDPEMDEPRNNVIRRHYDDLVISGSTNLPEGEAVTVNIAADISMPIGGDQSIDVDRSAEVDSNGDFSVEYQLPDLMTNIGSIQAQLEVSYESEQLLAGTLIIIDG